ncbi:hypothetical protein DYB31_003143 [Aphanomyces astaci]|uniref:Uncharacterized protein n=2 Tax=Aphanomyces astaci TaxID=112090 RepID=A0A397ESA4_APHAT|nr:hypothetical protein DYB31_003143 [Aphanomyces astaci]
MTAWRRMVTPVVTLGTAAAAVVTTFGVATRDVHASRPSALRPTTLLHRFVDTQHVDVFETTLDAPSIAVKTVARAFFTSPVFQAERAFLHLVGFGCVSDASIDHTDFDVGDKLVVFRVVECAPGQLLFCWNDFMDVNGYTWLAVADEDGRITVQFGSTFDVSQTSWLARPVLRHVVLPLHLWYAQVIQEASAKLHALEKDLAEYDALAGVLKDLPTKLDHDIMVPLGKQAFVPGKIVHANEITAHLGGDLFAKQTASQTGAMVERKKTVKQIKHQEVWLESLHAKLGDVDNVLNLKKIYEDANIQEIKESEDESNEGIVDPSEFTQADYDMYFEIENQEAAKQAASSWDWDDAMRRMEALEQHEEGTYVHAKNLLEPTSLASMDKTAVTTHEAESIKQQGNAAFASAKYQAAVDLYSKAIALTPTAHTLYGNRSAAHFHLREFAHAQKDADAAIAINPTWAKGHFRRGQALAALGDVDLAADAYEEASKLKPSDKSALALAKQLRQQADNDKNLQRLSTTHDVMVLG